MNTNNSPISLPVLKVDRNRWFVVSLLLAITVLVFAYDNVQLRKDRSDLDIAWVRVFPNSSWDVSFNDMPNQPQFFQSTIDAVLERFVKARYSKDPQTVRAEYGAAIEFMSPLLSKNFKSESGFDAAEVASKLIACGNNCGKVMIANPIFEHIEKTPTINKTNVIYRTNVYVDEVSIDALGARSVEESIISLEWRIMGKSEIIAKYPRTKNNDQMLSYLRFNPVGIEIVNTQRYFDPSDKPVK